MFPRQPGACSWASIQKWPWRWENMDFSSLKLSWLLPTKYAGCQQQKPTLRLLIRLLSPGGLSHYLTEMTPDPFHHGGAVICLDSTHSPDGNQWAFSALDASVIAVICGAPP